MSKATKRKHVTKEVTEEFILPGDNLKIVKVLVSRGNNLHEVETPSGETFLASMPTKFRKNVWIKRGDYVMVESIAEGDKVKAEISNILYRPQINYIGQQGLWPMEFRSKDDKSATNPNSADSKNSSIPTDMLPPSSDSEDSCDSGEAEGEGNGEGQLCCNPNRQHHLRFNDGTDDEVDDEDD